MRRSVVWLLGVLMLAMAGPVSAATIGSADFLYDDDGDPTDGMDSGGADGVDTSGLWGTMNFDVVDNTLNSMLDGIEIKYSALDPTGGLAGFGYDVTSIAFMFDATNADALIAALSDVVLNFSGGGNLAADWEIVFLNDGSMSGGDGLPQPTNDVGSPPIGALIVDLALAESCGGGVIKTCGFTFGPGDMDKITLQFDDGSLSGLMLAEIFDFAYVRLQSVSPESIGGDGSLFLGGEVIEIPLPPAIALLGSGIMFLFGFVGLRRRSTTG